MCALRHRDRQAFGEDPRRHDPDATGVGGCDRSFAGAITGRDRPQGQLRHKARQAAGVGASSARLYTRRMSGAPIEDLNAAAHRVAVDLGERSYEVLIGAGLLGDARAWSSAPVGSGAMIVTNSTVAPLYLAHLQHVLLARHHRVHSVVLPDGEQHKDWQT